MRSYVILAAILAVSVAREIGYKDEELDDLEAQASSIELFKTNKEGKETLHSSASTYNSNYIPPSQRPPRPWNPPQNNYVPNIPPQNNYIPPQNNYIPPQNNYIPPQNNYLPNEPPIQNDYPQSLPTFPQIPNNQFPNYPQINIPNQPLNNYPTPAPPTFPTQNYPSIPVQNPFPQNPFPQNPTTQAPQQPLNPQAPQNDYYYPAVIKNEQYFGNDGKYNFEYQIADGTHVGESGYVLNPNTENENVVKKGWYSYTGADGRAYTVTWWADNSGYHAFGDHLPTPPPVPAAIQAALDQAAKDEAEKNKPLPQNPTYYPTTQAPNYYPTQPSYNPTQTYYPQQQQTYYPPSYGK